MATPTDPLLPLPLPRYVSRVDPRDLKGGHMVSDRNGYYDSQNIVVVGGSASTPPAYSVILHHSENREGGPGLQLYSTRSTDGGRTWSALAEVESPERQSHDGYQLVHRRADGSERIFLFYGWNVGSQYPDGADPGLTPLKRTDMQLDEGYWFRVSDDGGRTWGDQRWLVPVRRTRIDRENPWGGATMGMFLCDKPSVIDGAVYLAFQKTRDGAGETEGSEAFVLRSRNLLHVDNLADAVWETLPLGDAGLQAPGGELRLGEEPHVVQVGEVPGRLFCLWRAETGRLAATYSSDGGETWDAPFWLTHEGLPLGAGGVQELRNPRGSITPFRLRTAVGEPAEYVLLYYNNGRTERLGYVGRRVYWLTHGRSTPDGIIRWSQPEIALYWDGTGFEERPDWNPDWAIVDGPGYPDFAELADGTLVLVESNKLAVRYHEIEPRLLAYLRRQHALAMLPTEALVLDATVEAGRADGRGPVLADLRAGGGLSITVQLRGVAEPGDVLVSAFSTVTAALGEAPTTATITKGWSLTVTADGELDLFITDGFGTELRHATTTVASLWDGGDHVVCFLVDGGPKVVSVVVDERLDDGGARARQGWAFFDRGLGEVGGAEVTIGRPGQPVVRRLLVHDRALLVSEAIAAARVLRANGQPT
jgi:hypothetical protein